MLMDTDDVDSRLRKDDVFEDEEDELDSATPCQQIIQELDLPLGTAVISMAFPRVPTSSSNTKLEISPQLLQNNLVTALVCADSTVRLLSLPLMPPLPASKSRLELRNDLTLSTAGRGSWGEQFITIPNISGSRGIPSAISIALMPRSPDNTVKDEMEEEDSEEEDIEENWDVVVASCSPDQLSNLAIFRIPLSPDGSRFDDDPTDHDFLWRTEPLLRPGIAVDISVPHKSDNQQGPYVMIAEKFGAVRVYDCCADSEKNQGSWLRSYHPGFDHSSNGDVKNRRVLDAKWVIGGSAIAILTEDGEWGVWSAFLPLPVRRSDPIEWPPISGGIPTKFHLHGRLGGSSTIANTIKSSSGKSETRSKLAPMTPGIRKLKQEALFTGSTSRSGNSAFGGISVNPTGKSLHGQDEDEKVVLWHGINVMVISNFSAYCQSKLKGSGHLFGLGASSQIREMNNIAMGGEIRNAVSVFPCDDDLDRKGRPMRHSELLISGEHSLVVLAESPFDERKSTTYQLQAPPPVVDQQLLAQGELDIHGMNRILESMTSSTQGNPSQISGIAAKRKVGFAN